MRNILIKRIDPTVLLRRAPGGLQQLVRVTLESRTGERSGVLAVHGKRKAVKVLLKRIPAGESTHEVYVDENQIPDELEFRFSRKGVILDQKRIRWVRPRHWKVHLVQLSHHDVGYTDLPSRVIRLHDEYLNQAIDLAAATRRFPEESQFRITVEQAWSVDHFVRHARPERVAKLVKLMRSGHVEITALFGNMTTEICGHEALIRTFYHAFNLKRRFGIPIVSANHNDITGVSWGLCRVLADVGIRIFCPGIPRWYYYPIDGTSMNSFWDEHAIFPTGTPGAFWWEAPDGKRVLFWHQGAIALSSKANLSPIADELLKLETGRYPHDIARWPVLGSGQDNSPYIVDYAWKAKAWNEQWAYPKMICSTNHRFYEDFMRRAPANLPTWRGELPGQDYPVGATSTAHATAVNRNNHAALLGAETLATVAGMVTPHACSKETIREAYEDVLWYNEHTWGMFFPCGPAMNASVHEKANHAYRADALQHDVAVKAIAGLADQVRLKKAGIHMVVANTLGYPRCGVVRMPLSEFRNCARTTQWVPPEKDPEKAGYYQCVFLNDRNFVDLPPEFMQGHFTLVDVATGKETPFQLIAMTSANDPVPFAAQRFGLGSSRSPYGLRSGLKRELCFVVRNIPAVGYRTFRLEPRKKPPQFTAASLKGNDACIENEFYRLRVSPKTGAIVSLFDKDLEKELVDRQAPHPFGGLIVRSPDPRQEHILQRARVRQGVHGPVAISLEITGSVRGHPRFHQTITLYRGLKQVAMAVSILKDQTPHLDGHIAFPFALSPPRFRYEGSLAVMEPIKDYLPGSYSDNVAVQNWVKVSDGNSSVVWSSLDAPVVSLAALWPGYVSPAHRGIVPKHTIHPPQKPDDLQKGWVYSNIFNNNFLTNFPVSQDGVFLFRYRITSGLGDLSDARSARIGWEAVTPFQAIFTRDGDHRMLPVKGGFVTIDNQAVVLLTMKPAADGRGIILRLWNLSDKPTRARIGLPHWRLVRVLQTNLVEEDTKRTIPHDRHAFGMQFKPNSLVTVRVRAE